MASRPRKPGSGRPHLVVRLRRGWTFEPRRRCFTAAGQAPFHPDLPRHTRIALQVPELARSRSRSPAEDALARSIQILPPRGVPPGRLLARVRSWPCVEAAWVAPTPAPAS